MKHALELSSSLSTAAATAPRSRAERNSPDRPRPPAAGDTQRRVTPWSPGVEFGSLPLRPAHVLYSFRVTSKTAADSPTREGASQNFYAPECPSHLREGGRV